MDSQKRYIDSGQITNCFLFLAVAIFNSAGCLEIAINQSRASQLLFPKNFNAHPDFNISIDFEE